jgi:WD40 repeat protein/tetratricopeptide (TPR) repeat protein
LAEDLERFLKHQPIRARRTPALERGWRWCLRNPLAASLVGLVITAAMGASFAALWLSAAQQATLEQLHKTQEAEEAGQRKLFGSLMAEARASRLSQRIGRRFHTLDVLTDAAQLARRLKLDDEEFCAIRSEAASCLALTDLRVDHQWETLSTGTGHIAFDGELKLYARTDRQQAVGIHRMADNVELFKIPGVGPAEAWPFLSDDGEFLILICNWQLRLWKLAGSKPIPITQIENCHGFCIHPNNRQFAVGHLDGTIRIHELSSGRETKTVRMTGLLTGLAFNPRKPQIAASYQDGAQVLDLETGNVLADFAHGTRMTAPAWHPEGQWLAVAGSNGRITIWDVPAGKPRRFLEGFTNTLTELAFNHSGTLLASTGWEGILRFWSPHTGKQLFSADGTSGAIRFSPDDRHLAGCDGNKVGLWLVADGREYRSLIRDSSLLDQKYPADIASDSKHRLLATAVGDGIQLSDSATGADLAFLKIAPQTHHVAFDPRGALLTNAPYGVWRWPIREVQGPGTALTIGPPEKLYDVGKAGHISVSADGLVSASAMSDDGACILRAGETAPIWVDRHKDIRSVAVSPDGKLVATGSFNNTGVRVRESKGGPPVKELARESNPMRVEFSPNSQWLATGCGEPCRVWRVSDWQQIMVAGDARSFVFSPNSSLLALDTGRGAIRLIDPETGFEFVRLEDPHQSRGDLAFSGDGAQLITTSDEPAVHIWDLRAIREGLAKMGLDWNLPAYPPSPDLTAPPVRISVDLGPFGDDVTPYALPELVSCSLALALQPFNAEVSHRRAVARALLQQWREAGDDCAHSLVLHKGRVETRYLRAQVLQRLGRQWEAATELSEAVALEPARVPTMEEVQRALAFDLHSAEQCNELAWGLVSGPPSGYVPGLAVFLAERLVLLNPRNWFYRNTLGVAYYRLGSWQQAAHVLELSLALSADKYDAFDLYYLSMVYQRLGQFELAKTCFERADHWRQTRRGLTPNDMQELTSARAEAASILMQTPRASLPGKDAPARTTNGR